MIIGENRKLREKIGPTVEGFDLEETWSKITRTHSYLTPAAPYKDQLVYGFYEEYLPRLLPIQNLLELGIYKGGSLVLWHEALGCRVIGVDLSAPYETMPLLDRWLDETGSRRSVAFHWHTDQTDETRLRSIVAKSTDGPLDIVIDDASHLYLPTRRSFEVLFPLLRPGGAYFIEDWRAGTRPRFRTAEGTVDMVLKEILDAMRDAVLPAESMCAKIGEGITACALILKSTSASTPQLRSVVPDRAHAGEPFNVQPDGQSAISIICENAVPGTVVMFSGTPLPTTFGSEHLLSAFVPSSLYEKPSVVDVWLRHPGESERVPFVIDP